MTIGFALSTFRNERLHIIENAPSNIANTPNNNTIDQIIILHN